MNENTPTHADWIDRTVYDSNGDKLGDVTNIYADDETGRPDWMTISTGWFGSSEQFVPIAGTSAHGEDLRVAFTEAKVKEAPAIDDEEHLSADEERRLFAHYGMNMDDKADVDTDLERADEGYGYSDPRADERKARPDANTGGKGDASVVRSEEELDVDKTTHEAGKVRLRKYVVTEDVNVTVPVRKQVARVTREKVDGTSGTGKISDDETVEEITLQEEEINVDKKVVAKEKVGLETETVTEDKTVSDTVRKERVETDGETQQQEQNKKKN